jgi:hypothetical protein
MGPQTKLSTSESLSEGLQTGAAHTTFMCNPPTSCRPSLYRFVLAAAAAPLIAVLAWIAVPMPDHKLNSNPNLAPQVVADETGKARKRREEIENDLPIVCDGLRKGNTQPRH